MEQMVAEGDRLLQGLKGKAMGRGTGHPQILSLAAGG